MGRSSWESFKVYFIFPEKWFCSYWEKFGIFKPCTNIKLFRRFDWGFWKEDLEKIYRKLQYVENAFWNVSRFALFSRKIGFILLTKLYLFEPCTNIRSLQRLDLGFWQTLKKVCFWVLKKKLFRKFQGQPCLPTKIILYSLTEFGIIKPCTNIQSLIRFDVSWWFSLSQYESYC